VASGVWAHWLEDVNAWRAADEGKDAAVYDALFTVRRWWWARHLDMGYLSAPPTIRFWRIGDTVTLKWDTCNCEIDGVPCWVESAGRQDLSLEAFEGEMEGFRERLGVDMQVQLQALLALGLVDAEGLASLQRQHDLTLAPMLEQYVPDWNWEETLRAIREIEVASGIQLGSSDSNLSLRS
jgi:hypothetical protein